MDEKKKGDLTEAFEVLGNKADTVDLNTFGIILRSVGMNPTGDEIKELFTSASGGSGIDVAGALKAAETFETTIKSKNTDQECVAQR